MWKCKNCETISEGNFCNHCGAPRPEQSESLVKTTKNKGLIITLVICSVVLVVLLAGFVVTEVVRTWIEENDTSFVQPPKEEEIEEILDEFEDFSEENPVVTPAPTPTPVPQKTEAPASQNAQKKRDFLERARQIEIYEENAMNMSMPQQDINYETGVVFSKWDALLNDVYQYLKKTLPTSEFNALRKAEIKWIKEKEAACERAEDEWEGGSGAPMAWNMTASSLTKARVYELIDMID